ncbi:hypothetical protein ACLMJK_003626 [Lecanora helva]
MSQGGVATAAKKKAKHSHEPAGLCRGCGTIEIAGWTSQATIIKEQKQSKTPKNQSINRARPKIADTQSKYVKIECMRCNRFVKKLLSQPFSEASALPTSTATATKKQDLPLSRPSQNNIKSINTNASSKQRAKARKQGGLQAILEKSKASASPSSGFGLDLLDLMQRD